MSPSISKGALCFWIVRALLNNRLVHRLDKNTSGAMVVARNKDAAAWISQAFVERSRKAKDSSYKGVKGSLNFFLIDLGF